jgi:hypothetical protein
MPDRVGWDRPFLFDFVSGVVGVQVLKLLGGQLFPASVEFVLYYDSHREVNPKSALIFASLQAFVEGKSYWGCLHPAKGRRLQVEMDRAAKRVLSARAHVADVTLKGLALQRKVRATQTCAICATLWPCDASAAVESECNNNNKTRKTNNPVLGALPLVARDCSPAAARARALPRGGRRRCDACASWAAAALQRLVEVCTSVRVCVHTSLPATTASATRLIA